MNVRRTVAIYKYVCPQKKETAQSWLLRVGRRPKRPRRGRNDTTLRRVPRRGAWRRVSCFFPLFRASQRVNNIHHVSPLLSGGAMPASVGPLRGPSGWMDVLNPHATHPFGVRAVRLTHFVPSGDVLAYGQPHHALHSKIQAPIMISIHYRGLLSVDYEDLTDFHRSLTKKILPMWAGFFLIRHSLIVLCALI